MAPKYIKIYWYMKSSTLTQLELNNIMIINFTKIYDFISIDKNTYTIDFTKIHVPTKYTKISA